MNKLFSLALLSFALFTASAHADSLDDARRAGQVGETAGGYVAAIGTPSTSTRMLVSSINSGRKMEYEKIAARNGQTVDVVEKLAAQKIFSNVPAGTQLQNASGGWTKK